MKVMEKTQDAAGHFHPVNRNDLMKDTVLGGYPCDEVRHSVTGPANGFDRDKL